MSEQEEFETIKQRYLRRQLIESVELLRFELISRELPYYESKIDYPRLRLVEND